MSKSFNERYSLRDLDKIIADIKKRERIPESQVKDLCEKAKEIFSQQKNVVKLQGPVTICGDIHGQFFDLLELFKIGGDLPETQYVFLGDFVDRGHNSVEVILLLLAYVVRYPDRITLIRGNHESRLTSMHYGFYDECKRKYGTVNVWQCCVDLFDYIPLGAIVDEKIFCIHGGLSPHVSKIDELQDINRFKDVPHEGPMSDLLWSDPDDSLTGWGKSQRGAGFLFGKDIVDKFNRENDIDLICRAHQLVQEGYKQLFDNKLVTVWSAPNYMYRCNNVAAILEIDENHNKSYNVFESSTEEQQMVSENLRRVPDYFL